MLFVPLTEIKGRNKFALLRFVCKYEFLNVQFAALLKKNISGCFAVYLKDFCPRDLYGVFCVKKTVFHIFPFAGAGVETALSEDFVNSFCIFYKSENLKNPLCINGAKPGTDLILKCFEKLNLKPSQTNEYNLLKLDGKIFLQKLKKESSANQKFRIVNCKSSLTEEIKAELFALQAEYEKEEVVPSCFEFDENLCRLRFMASMRTQFVLALKNQENHLVAKGGTNAIGFKYVQLGGIFTRKEFRGEHCAKYLLESLLFSLLKIRKSVALFVKKENIPAEKLYNSLGFKKISEYSIAYFKHNL